VIFAPPQKKKSCHCKNNQSEKKKQKKQKKTKKNGFLIQMLPHPSFPRELSQLEGKLAALLGGPVPVRLDTGGGPGGNGDGRSSAVADGLDRIAGAVEWHCLWPAARKVLQSVTTGEEGEVVFMIIYNVFFVVLVLVLVCFFFFFFFFFFFCSHSLSLRFPAFSIRSPILSSSQIYTLVSTLGALKCAADRSRRLPVHQFQQKPKVRLREA
jgi:hypothetical protein